MRGALTVEIQDIANNFLKRDINTKELRLMPYIQYVMTNEQKIDIQRINQEEREILSKWRKKGYITGGASPMTMTKEFWDFICEIIYLSYVNHVEESK